MRSNDTKGVKAVFRSGSGSLELRDEEINEEVASFVFGTHLQDWKWPGLPRVRKESRAPLHSSSNNQASAAPNEQQKIQQAYSMLDGTTGPIWINTKVWWDEADQSVVMDGEAVPRFQDEPRVCSCSIVFALSSNRFGDGTILIRSALKLPSVSSPPRADYNLFGSAAPENRLSDTDGFVVKSKDGSISLEIRIDQEKTTSSMMVFTDVRQWGPHFNVRLGDSTNFDWKSGSVRTWRIRIKSINHSHNSTIPLGLSLQENGYALTAAQIKQFQENGYLVLSNLIPREMLTKALRNINKSIGKGVPADQLASFNAGSWCHELRNHASLTSLFKDTKVRGVVDSFLGAENVPDHTGGHVQIALRFPTDPPATKPEHFHHHIDGIPTDTNGLVKGQLYPFTMLVGVYLNEVQDDNAGNLIVYPGTHLRHAEYFKQHGPESLLQHNPFIMPKINMPPPVQLKIKEGDVLFAHYLLAHSVASNVSANVRYALYFRVTSALQGIHDSEEKYKSMKHAWIDWPVYHQQ